ncbi:MAG: hypothetical protein GY749_38935 [Desulfobacteraceae bacterium]|nr:hypothetical protein [Desulfobacteraceae bacterium]
MKEWIPKEILDMPEFLSEDLKKLRDYLTKRREEDFIEISLVLHVYEERVLFYYELPPEQRIILPWSVIGTYEDESYKSSPEQKRKVKEYFLTGWLEDQLWDVNLQEQQEENIPERSEKNRSFY